MYTVYSNQLKIITYKYMYMYMYILDRCCIYTSTCTYTNQSSMYMYRYMYILDIYCIYTCTCTYTNQTILKTADKRVMMKSKLSKGLVC